MSARSALMSEVTEETARGLRQRAQQQGKSLDQFLREIAELDPPISPNELTSEEWRRRFDAFLAQQVSHNPQIDDSRDSIYEGRGE